MQKKNTSASVFLVTSGCYSDYGIRGAFSTREKAQQFIDTALPLAERNASDEFDGYIADVYFAKGAEIEEWPLDELLKSTAFRIWTVGMLLDDGSVVEPRNPEYESWKFEEHFRSKIVQFGAKIPAYQNRPIVRVESSVSQEHALKLAAEKRQEWLRKKTEKAQRPA